MSRPSVADFSDRLWRYDQAHGPYLESSTDQVAVATRAARAFPNLGVDHLGDHFRAVAGRVPPRKYLEGLATELRDIARNVGIVEDVVGFRAFAIREMSQVYGKHLPGGEGELKLALLAYITSRGFQEAHTGAGRMDIRVPEEDAVVETKIWKGGEDFEAGLEELEAYLRTEGATQGLYVVFCRSAPLPDKLLNPDKPIDHTRLLAGITVPIIFVPLEIVPPSKVRKTRRQTV